MRVPIRRMTAWFFLISTSMNFSKDNPATWFGLAAGLGFWVHETIWGEK